MKTIQEIKDFIKGTVVHSVRTPGADYPFYFLGEESMGWAEYIDFSNFDPFFTLGFIENSHNIEVPDEVYEAHGGYGVDDDINSIFYSGKNLTEAFEAVKALDPAIVIDTSEDVTASFRDDEA